jgi:uncharacterized membrane protein YozB (DUF420 family)
MIIGIIIDIFTSIVNFFVGLLPTTGFPESVTSGITGLVQSAYGFNNIFPVDTLLIVLGLALTFEAIILGWNGSKYVIQLIRGN